MEKSFGIGVGWQKHYEGSAEKVDRWRARGEKVMGEILQGGEGQRIEKLLQSGCLVFDVGSGEGYNSLRLSGQYPIRAIGVDVSGDATTKARAESERIGIDNAIFIEADIRTVFDTDEMKNTLAEGRNQFGMVLDFRSTQFLTDSEKEDFLDRVARNVDPEGYYLLEAFIPTKENAAVALSPEQVERIYGRHFDIVETIEMSGTRVYIMRRKSEEPNTPNFSWQKKRHGAFF